MKVGRRDVAVENKALLLLTAKPSMKQRLIEESMQFGTVLLQRIESSSKCEGGGMANATIIER